MENEKKSGISIWLLLSPLYLLLLFPLGKLIIKNQSADLNIDKNAFSVDTTLEKKHNSSGYQPILNNSSYNISYAAGATEEEREAISWGAQAGYLSAALEQNAGDTAFIKELYNNKFVIRGFMARENVQYYLFSSENLAKLFSNKDKVRNFLASPSIKALFSNPQSMQIILDSAFANALISEQAAQDFMRDNAAIERILTDNRMLVRVIKTPVIKKFITNNKKLENLAKAVGWK